MAAPRVLQDLANGLDHRLGGGDEREEGDDGVVGVLLEDDVEVRPDQVEIVERLGGDVDGVAGRGVGELRLQPGLRAVAHRGDLEPAGDRLVRHLDADPAGDAHQRDPPARRERAE